VLFGGVGGEGLVGGGVTGAAVGAGDGVGGGVGVAVVVFWGWVEVGVLVLLTPASI
jgi:hypothetical protein